MISHTDYRIFHASVDFKDSQASEQVPTEMFGTSQLSVRNYIKNYPGIDE
jgi:hypothetical protein